MKRRAANVADGIRLWLQNKASFGKSVSPETRTNRSETWFCDENVAPIFTAIMQKKYLVSFPFTY